MVVIDSNLILLILEPTIAFPSIPYAKERIQQLLDSIAKSGGPILVPTPVLAEILVRAGSARERYLDVFRRSPNFRIAGFGVREAVECAVLLEGELERPRGEFDDVESKSKIKFDQMIISIAKANNVECLYSEGEKLRASAERAGVQSKSIGEVQLPAEMRQMSIEEAGGGEES